MQEQGSPRDGETPTAALIRQIAEIDSIGAELRELRAELVDKLRAALTTEALLASIDRRTDAAWSHLRGRPGAPAPEPPPARADDPNRICNLLEPTRRPGPHTSLFLGRAGIRTVEELQRMTRRELLRVCDMGPRRVAEVEAALAGRGLSLLPDPSEA